MLAKITAYNGAIYRFATSTQDTADGIYTGRIVEEIDFTSQSSDNGAAPNTINITIRNDDNFIPKNIDLWGATIDLTATNGKSWRGKITFFSFDSDGNVYITATEKSLPELELQMPDEVRQVYTIDDNFHQSSQTMTIPLVIGGTHSSPISLPTILIDKQNGIYLVCTGEIREIVKVYNGSKELPSTAYTAYTGTAAQAEHKGFAYVKINSDYRTNADGSYAEINVDVVGLKLGNHTEAECRNGARFLYYFLTTPATGINGWGLGISPSDIDTASFNTAITLCDASNFKLDGIMWLRQGADAWINQICQATHGKYSININGKRTLTIDYAGAASKATFGPNDMKISRYGKNAYTGAIYNKGVFSYGYNPITGLFMQSAQYENSESVAQIGEQKFVGESYLINDAATALAVLEYTCKKSQIAAESIEFETDRLETLLFAGDLITISRSDISISGTFQIKSISTSESKSTISASRFDSSVFIVGGTHTNINWNSEKPITPALTPAEATNLLLTTGFDINPDGTGNPYIKGTFTPPAGGWIAAAVQYGIGTNPANWTELALITNGQFVIQPVSVGAVYSVRVRMITATGHSDYITGQITAAGDSVPPEIPTIAVNATDKSVIVQCAIDNPPYDMGGFQIHRKKHSESVYTLIGNVAANRGYASTTDYVDDWVAYDYKAKSYDRSGNLSDFSEVKTVVVTGIQANDVAATALKIPTGSILRLSAKGCDSTSIKSANGVKDVSGYNHHGQAYGGVSVLDGGEGFGFDGVSGSRLEISVADYTATTNGFTITCKAKSNLQPTSYNPIATAYKPSDRNTRMFIFYQSGVTGKVGFNFKENYTASEQDIKVETDIISSEKMLTATIDCDNGLLSFYVDGIKANEIEIDVAELDWSLFNYVHISSEGGVGRAWNGTIKDFRIYPRALSATEVKSMYMLPDEAIFGQLNADLIGANVIKASNLVKTEALITESAQIGDAVITNAKISNVESEKITSANIQSGAITIGNISNTVNARVFETIQSGADINSMRDNRKTYYSSNTVVCQSLLNKPSGMPEGEIVIEFDNAGSPNYGTQRLNAKYGAINRSYQRSYSNDTWGAWKDLQAWCYNNDTTYINGGNIYTNTIKANSLSVEALRFPNNLFFGFNAKGYNINHVFNNGDIIGDISGLKHSIKVVDTATGGLKNSSSGTFGIDYYFMPSKTAYIEIANSSAIPNWTFSTWLYKASSGSSYETLLSQKVSGAFELECQNSDGTLCIRAYGTTAPYNTTTYGSNTQVYVTVSVSGDTIKIYINGVLKSTGTASASGLYAMKASPILIGAWGANAAQKMTGYITNTLFFNRALTDEEIMTLYKLGTDTESGQITADRIATDAIKSRTLSGGGDGSYTTSGSMFNLAGNGYISMAKFCVSSAGKLKCKEAEIEGKITASSGKIGNLDLSGGNLTLSTNSDIKVINLTNTANTTNFKTSAGGFSGTATVSGNTFTSVFETYYASITLTNMISGSATNTEFFKAYPGYAEMHRTSTSTNALRVQGSVIVNGSTVHGSDRNIKSDIKPTSTLNRLKQLNIYSWKYDDDKLALREYNKKIAKGENTEKPRLGNGAKNNPTQIGPMAQDFNALFGTNGDSEEYLNYADTIGVALRACQELSEQLDDAVREIRRLKRILKSQNILTDEIISEDRDNEAIRRLAIAQARQARRDEKIQKIQNDTDKEPNTDENNIIDSDTDNSDGVC